MARDELKLDPERDQVREARRFVAALAPPWIADDAALVTSELVSNAVEHAATPLCRSVESTAERVRIEVSDSSSILPAVGDLLAEGERGRGLYIVEQLATAWGVESRDNGKVVWFEITTQAERSVGRLTTLTPDVFSHERSVPSTSPSRPTLAGNTELTF